MQKRRKLLPEYLNTIIMDKLINIISFIFCYFQNDWYYVIVLLYILRIWSVGLYVEIWVTIKIKLIEYHDVQLLGRRCTLYTDYTPIFSDIGISLKKHCLFLKINIVLWSIYNSGYYLD